MNMRSLCTVSISCLACIAATGSANAQPAGTMREINLTTDSAPGWLPGVELEKSALETVAKFFQLNDAGDYQASYAMLDPGTRTLIKFDEFSKANNLLRTEAGKLIHRRMIKITWTKDPAQAPKPGIYAAIDAAATFQNTDRQCGYIVLYQAPQGGPFVVTRTENNSISNASAKESERRQSKAALDSLWTGLSANCPNFQAPASPAALVPRT